MLNEYDVLIYEVATGKVEEVIGPYPDSGFYNINRMESSVASRLNSDFNTKVVETGSVREGQIIGENE